MGNHGGAAVGSTEGVAPEEASLRKGRGKDIAPARQARRADAAPFSTLGLLDRLVFDNPEPLVTLAALAGATSRIRLQAEVLIAPQHNTALLAKQTATLDRLSGGRFNVYKRQASTCAAAAVGADEVVLYCWSSDPDQVGRLADTLF